MKIIMTESNLNTLVQVWSDQLVTYVLMPIIEFLTEKGYNVTVDELINVLNLPVSKTVQSINTAMPFGGPVPNMAPSVTGSRKQNAATTQPQPGRSCIYKYKRGDNKGKYCGKPTNAGADHCNACLKTRKNLTKESTTTPGAAPGAGEIPTTPGLPQGYTPPNTASESNGSLTVIPFDESRDLYLEPHHNFIIHSGAQGIISVIGKLIKSDKSSEIVELTAQDKDYAQTIGLKLADDNTPSNPSVPSTSSMPANIPVIPFTSSTPPVSAIPAIPNLIPNK